MTNLKAIIFDWGGVCCSGAEPFASKELQEAVQKNPDEIAAGINNIYTDYYRGVYMRDAFWQAVLDHFALETTPALNPEKLSAAYTHSYEVYPTVLEAIKKLRVHYRVGLLSNLTPEMRDHIRRAHSTSELFNEEVYSCDAVVAELKPDSKPYQIILEKLGVSPEEALFIDDSQTNIEAAAALGLKTLFFTNQADFLEKIKLYL